MKDKRKLRDIIADTTGVELPVTCVTVSDGGEASFVGCERIAEYEHDRIVLCLRGMNVSVDGCGLELDTYMTDRAVIRGRIDCLRFIRDGERE